MVSTSTSPAPASTEELENSNEVVPVNSYFPCGMSMACTDTGKARTSSAIRTFFMPYAS